jgi:hypothetical protein
MRPRHSKSYMGCGPRTAQDERSKLTETVTLMICVREIPSSNLGREMDYPDPGLSWIFPVLPGKFWDNTSTRLWQGAGIVQSV